MWRATVACSIGFSVCLGAAHAATVSTIAGSGAAGTADGPARRAVAIVAPQGLLVRPDNGLLPPAADAQGAPRRAVVLDKAASFAATHSPTFHARDIFPPVASRLSLCGDLLARSTIDLPVNPRLAARDQIVAGADRFGVRVMEAVALYGTLTSRYSHCFRFRSSVRARACRLSWNGPCAPSNGFQALEPSFSKSTTMPRFMLPSLSPASGPVERLVVEVETPQPWSVSATHTSFALARETLRWG